VFFRGLRKGVNHGLICCCKLDCLEMKGLIV